VKPRPLLCITLLTSLWLHSPALWADSNTDWGDWGLDSDQLMDELDRDDSPFEAIPEFEAPPRKSAHERRPLHAQEQAIFSELDNSDLSDYAPPASDEEGGTEDDEAFSLLEQLEQLEQLHNATDLGNALDAGEIDIYIEDGQLVIEPLEDEGELPEDYEDYNDLKDQPLDGLDPDSTRELIDTLDTLSQDGDTFTIDIDGTEVELDREDLENLETLVDFDELDDFETLLDELEEEFELDSDGLDHGQAGEYER